MSWYSEKRNIPLVKSALNMFAKQISSAVLVGGLFIPYNFLVYLIISRAI